MVEHDEIDNKSTPRLLIVDDEDLLVRTLQTFLRMRGYEVETCATPAQALDHPALSQIDLLLADLQLPQMDGIELIGQAQARYPDLSAVLMTGHASVDSAVQAMRGGAVDYLQKPFALSALEAVVVRALKVQKLQRANRALQATLLKRNAELTTVNQDLDAFAARLAHDLRGPINNVRGIVAFLREEIGADLETDLQELLDRAVRSGDQSLRMVSDLLDFARLGHGHLRLVPLPLEPLLTRCIEAAALNLPPERFYLEIGPLPSVLGHEGLLFQVFLNLLDNAIKYSAPKPQTRVSVVAHPRGESHVDVVVSDNGVGFDPQHAELLFRPFQRLHSRSEFSGAGMGLANVKRIVERHGGQVVASGAPGEGATITVTLQLA